MNTHIVCDLCAWCLSLKHDFSRFTHVAACVSTVLFYCSMLLHFMYTPHFLLPGAADVYVSRFSLWLHEHAAVNTHTFVWTRLPLPGNNSEWTAGSYSNSTFNPLKNCQLVFQSGCITSHPTSCARRLCSDFFALTHTCRE